MKDISLTHVTLKEHLDALRSADDRRYSEVDSERERAIKIKEDADKTALGLAREIQQYKDEKANDLRSQIERERGTYTTKDEVGAAVDKLQAIIKPLSDWVAAQQGRGQGFQSSWAIAIAVITVALAAVAIFLRH